MIKIIWTHDGWNMDKLVLVLLFFLPCDHIYL